jgi:hypothetical protein
MKERQKERAKKHLRLPEWYLEKFRRMKVPCAHTMVKYENDDIEPTFYCAVHEMKCSYWGNDVCENVIWGCEDYAPMLTCAYCAYGGNNQWHSSLKTHCALIHQHSGEIKRELEDQNDLSPCDFFRTHSDYGTHVDTYKVRDMHLRAIYKEAWEKNEHYGFINEKYIPKDRK